VNPATCADDGAMINRKPRKSKGPRQGRMLDAGEIRVEITGSITHKPFRELLDVTKRIPPGTSGFAHIAGPLPPPPARKPRHRPSTLGNQLEENFTAAFESWACRQTKRPNKRERLKFYEDFLKERIDINKLPLSTIEREIARPLLQRLFPRNAREK
jgi:hypothetical protein